jgi:hypothetical protein
VEEGAAVYGLELEKMFKYAALADRRFYGFIPMCVETWGPFGHKFIEPFKELAEAAARRNEALNNMSPDIGACQVRRYMRRLSLARVRGMAKRIQSAMFGVGRNMIAAAGMAARLDDREEKRYDR